MLLLFLLLCKFCYKYVKLREAVYLLNQEFTTWGECTPRGTQNRRQKVFNRGTFMQGGLIY